MGKLKKEPLDCRSLIGSRHVYESLCLRVPMPKWLRVVLHEVRNLPNYRAMTTAGPTLVRAALKKRTR